MLPAVRRGARATYSGVVLAGTGGQPHLSVQRFSSVTRRRFHFTRVGEALQHKVKAIALSPDSRGLISDQRLLWFCKHYRSKMKFKQCYY
jgi:hypothetical protein